MKFLIHAAAKTDVGAVRLNNEGNFGYDIRHGIFVVCDGMGGQAAGELASKIAVETVLDHFRRDARGSKAKVLGRAFGGVSQRANKLANAIQLANHAIRQAAVLNVEHSGMGSTIVAVLADNDGFSVAHVGDSRVYWIRGEFVQQLTSDHSLVMEQVRRGLITWQEAQHSKMQNVIVRALGADESIEPDLQDREFASGDMLLLCSDGLSRYVEDSTILELIQGNKNLESCYEKLIQAAKYHVPSTAGVRTILGSAAHRPNGVREGATEFSLTVNPPLIISRPSVRNVNQTTPMPGRHLCR